MCAFILSERFVTVVTRRCAIFILYWVFRFYSLTHFRSFPSIFGFAYNRFENRCRCVLVLSAPNNDFWFRTLASKFNNLSSICSQRHTSRFLPHATLRIIKRKIHLVTGKMSRKNSIMSHIVLVAKEFYDSKWKRWRKNGHFLVNDFQFVKMSACSVWRRRIIRHTATAERSRGCISLLV